MPMNRGLNRFSGGHQPGAYPWSATIHASGTAANRPSACPANAGFLYFATDTSILYRSSGVAWTQVGAAAESAITFTDITTNNASTSKHGYLLKLDNNAAHYMDGTGAWSTPSGGGGGVGGSSVQTFLTTGDVALNNTSNYFDVINTGSIGGNGQMWWITASVVVGIGSGAGDTFLCRIWDGTTTYREVTVLLFVGGSTTYQVVTFDKLITLSAATTFKLSCKDVSSTSGVVKNTAPGGTASVATSITAIRLT